MKTIVQLVCEACENIITQGVEVVIFEGAIYTLADQAHALKDTQGQKWAICGNCFRTWLGWKHPATYR